MLNFLQLNGGTILLTAVLVLAVVRAMSRNCQKRYEENMKFERASGELAGNFILEEKVR